jgi:transposase InsO family protein
VNIVGPLLVSKEGFTHLFTMINGSSRWMEGVVAPLTAISVADYALPMVREWVFLFGVPDAITSDCDAQFTSTLWSAFCGILGIQHHPTTAYIPQANGMVEHFHRQLKKSLRAWLCGTARSKYLPWMLSEL